MKFIRALSIKSKDNALFYAQKVWIVERCEFCKLCIEFCNFSGIIGRTFGW